LAYDTVKFAGFASAMKSEIILPTFLFPMWEEELE